MPWLVYALSQRPYSGHIFSFVSVPDVCFYESNWYFLFVQCMPSVPCGCVINS